MSDDQVVTHYQEMVNKVYILSKVAAMKFNGPREDAQAQFIITLEIFKNLANYQLAVINKLVTEKLGISGKEFAAISCEVIEDHLRNMEESLAVKSWGPDGPIFDLDKFREISKGWPTETGDKW